MRKQPDAAQSTATPSRSADKPARAPLPPSDLIKDAAALHMALRAQDAGVISMLDHELGLSRKLGALVGSLRNKYKIQRSAKYSKTALRTQDVAQAPTVGINVVLPGDWTELGTFSPPGTLPLVKFRKGSIWMSLNPSISVSLSEQTEALVGNESYVQSGEKWVPVPSGSTNAPISQHDTRSEVEK